MNDREMLELAAKAAGMELSWQAGWKGMPDLASADGRVWNPIAHKGDALDLAMRLNMCVSIHDNHCMACAQKGEVQVVKDVPTEEAVLLAITRAAAEIGKQMGGGDV